MSARLVLFALGAFVPSLTAQSVFVVDASGGAGSQFTTIAPAVAAAAAGDTVLVRAGTYQELLSIDKGIRLIGQGATLLANFLALTDVLVHDVPAGEVFTMRGFSSGVSAAGSVVHVRVQDCAGQTGFRDLMQGPGQWGMTIAGSDQVHVAEAVLTGCNITDSRAVLEAVVVDGAVLHGVAVVNSEVDTLRCSIRGSIGPFIGPGIRLDSGTVRLVETTVTGGNVGQPAILTVAGLVVLDPTSSLQAGAGAPMVGGPATVLLQELPALEADTDGSTLTVRMIGVTGNGYAAAVSLPGARQPTVFGDLWLDLPSTVVLGSGVVPANRRIVITVPHGPIPVGAVVTLQGVAIGSTLQTSVPSVVAFP